MGLFELKIIMITYQAIIKMNNHFYKILITKLIVF